MNLDHIADALPNVVQYIKDLRTRGDLLQAKVDDLVGQVSRYELEKLEMRERIEAATKRARTLLEAK